MKIIRVMCTGRIDMSFILRAFSNGTDGVFMGGCWLGECHYLTQGNYEALSMMLITRKLMKLIGIDPARLRMEFVSASQGARFAEVVTNFTNTLRELGPISTDLLTQDENGIGLKIKLDALQSLIPYIKLVERERLRVHFSTEEEYHKFFDSDEVNRLFKELIVDVLATKQIMLLLQEGPQSVERISDILSINPSDVSRYLSNSTKEGLVRFDEKQKVFAPV